MRLSLQLALVIFVAVGGVAASIFEDVDPRNVRGWHQQDLQRRVDSMTSSSTSTTSASTNSAGFPTGPKPTNTGCTMSSQCSTGNCQGGKCKPTQDAGKYGCYKDQNCSTGHCVNGKCVPKDGQGMQDEPCNMSGQCASGSFCNKSACDTQKGLGDACYKNNGCSSGNCVTGSNGKKTCVADATVPPNNPCTKSTQCQNPGTYFCNNARCDTKKGAGKKCYKGQGCVSGRCKRNRTCA